VTDKRKEGQQMSSKSWQIANDLMAQNMLDVTCEQAVKVIEGTLAAQPQPRGSEALREKVLDILMDIKLGNFGMYEQYARPKMEAIMSALAAATAERTPLPVEGWLTPEWLQEVLLEYAPKQAEKMGYQTLKQIAEALAMPGQIKADRQPAQPQPEAPEQDTAGEWTSVNGELRRGYKDDPKSW
jgi:hypothetical protein